MAVHDSKESWEKFRDGTLLPRLQAGVEGGFPTPPEETEIDLETPRPAVNRQEPLTIMMRDRSMAASVSWLVGGPASAA